jgi:hypothetical protein
VSKDEWERADLAVCLLAADAGRLSARRLRLALCASLRAPALWRLLTSPSSRRAVEVAEAFADGGASARELGLANRGAHGACSLTSVMPDQFAAWLASFASYQDASHGLDLFVSVVRGSGLDVPAAPARDVIGDPFRPLVLDASLLTPEIASLARAAYKRRLPDGRLDPNRVSILADALEEAGAGGELLAHLRGPGLHVRGCHVVDLLLGQAP